MLEDVRLVKSRQYSAKVQPSQKCEGWTFAEYQEYFDDNFFAYYEDADLSCRMRLRGWQTVTVPRAVVHHVHSATTDGMASSFKAYYLNRNRFLMMFKNFPGKILWKGLWLVPRSYFKNGEGNKNKQNVGNGKFNSGQANGKKLILAKVKMIGVMMKVGGSVILNLPKLIWQRRQIRKRALIDSKNFEKWLG
jgi:cellulose synthase/poly-beta-1,6-N-acetylglucosamine synthase-like glycosyltransferase